MSRESPSEANVTLILCGDVMLGRGIDQILPDSVLPHLYEPYVRSAQRYVEIAEQVNGPITRGVGRDDRVPAAGWRDDGALQALW